MRASRSVPTGALPPPGTIQPAMRIHSSRPLIVLYLALGLCLAACSSPKESAPEAAGAGGGTTLKVRASVVALPGADAMLHLHHEAIPDYPGPDGKAMGMDSMTMPFPVTKDLALAGIAQGDRVEATMKVDWKADPSVQIVEVRELPADAPPLVFGEAAPANPS